MNDNKAPEAWALNAARQIFNENFHYNSQMEIKIVELAAIIQTHAERYPLPGKALDCALHEMYNMGTVNYAQWKQRASDTIWKHQPK